MPDTDNLQQPRGTEVVTWSSPTAIDIYKKKIRNYGFKELHRSELAALYKSDVLWVSQSWILWQDTCL